MNENNIKNMPPCFQSVHIHQIQFIVMDVREICYLNNFFEHDQFWGCGFVIEVACSRMPLAFDSKTVSL